MFAYKFLLKKKNQKVLYVKLHSVETLLPTLLKEAMPVSPRRPPIVKLQLRNMRKKSTLFLHQCAREWSKPMSPAARVCSALRSVESPYH